MAFIFLLLKFFSSKEDTKKVTLLKKDYYGLWISNSRSISPECLR